MHKGFVAIVGSREVPTDELDLFIRLGRTFTDIGLGDSSGDAFCSDRAGWWGARQSRAYSEVGARIYLTESYKARKRAAEHPFFIIAEDYPEKWDMAKALAFSARGNFNGLNDYGIGLHTRNVYQIYGHWLDDPVKIIVYYAPVVGKVENEFVKGGTNTALQIAKQAGIPVRVNLATEKGLEWAETFLSKYEEDYPYVEIDWKQILKADDPRLEYLT